MASNQNLYLVGLAPERRRLSQEILELVSSAEVLAGGQRLLDLFFDCRAEKIPLTTPLEAWLTKLKDLAREKKVVVIASGDPNFFGLARKLLTIVSPDNVRIIPSTTTVQEAFAHMQTTWHEAEVVSLHGRFGFSELWSALYRAGHLTKGRVAIYTDPQNAPDRIASELLKRGLDNWRMWTFEDLGTEAEKISTLSLSEAAGRAFSPLNLVVLEMQVPPAPVILGAPENNYIHEAGLITKSEVRAVVLGFLGLEPHHILWDLGAGSGSVSIEAAALLPYGAIWAVEKSPSRVEHIFANRARFGAAQISVVPGEILPALDDLPDPDRVFIGGGGAGLSDIIEAAVARLRPGGIILVSLVGVENMAAAIKTMSELGLEPSLSQIQASRSAPLAGGLYLKPLNPVWLVKGLKI